MNSYTPVNEKLAIIGLSPTSRHLAPFGDSSYDKWTLNNAFTQEFVPEWEEINGFFQIHDLETIKLRYDENYIQWMSEQKFPIFMQENIKSIPNRIVIDFDYIFNKYSKYISSSAAYMLIIAVECGYKHIDFFGFDMAAPSEYFIQRPNFEYWVGYFRGKGLEINMHETSPVLTGITYATEKNFMDASARLEANVFAIEQVIEAHKANVERLKGAIEVASQLDRHDLVKDFGQDLIREEKELHIQIGRSRAFGQIASNMSKLGRVV